MMGWICSHGNAIQAVLNAGLVANRPGNPGMKNKPKYIDIVTAFDIETTRLPDIEQSFIYVWQWQIGPDVLVMGRTWEEFEQFCSLLKAYILEVYGARARLVVWVHNLSYEFSFLKGIYPFQSYEVFAMDRRKIAKCSMYATFEFRCSYIHSNMSLDLFTKKMGCKIRKLTGTFDYDKIRYPWTPLTEDEKAYCIHDVAALVEAITIEMAADGDTLATIPMTSTGYVRRDAKEAMRSKPAFRSYINKQLPDFQLYLALREAFRGGNTHANRYYAGQIIKNVHSVDRSSSYPDVLVNCEFPVTEFKYWGEISYDRWLKEIDNHGRAGIIRVSFDDVELIDEFCGCPYLAKDKCWNIRGGVYDNGRILGADHFETTLTDIDFRIVVSMYKINGVSISDAWFARYGYLPDEFRNLICQYYEIKTALKGDDSQKVYYDKVKNKINALYGMTAQNPVKEDIIYAQWEEVEQYYLRHPDEFAPAPGANFIPNDNKTPEEMLAKYNRRAFLVYQWGVWVTAHARRELQEMIDLAGDNFVYTDTDSVKYIGEIDMSEYNNRITQRSKNNGACAVDSKGNLHCMGVYEREDDYERFVTLGAKKYGYDQFGECHVTCAGVNKKIGGEELQRHGGLEAFKPGMVFRDAGGTESVYNDNIDMVIYAEGKPLRIRDNVVIRPSEYTLGVTNEYAMLLHRVELLKSLQREENLHRTLDKMRETHYN